MLSAQLIDNFHFLRPWWALMFIPVLTTIALQWRRSEQTLGWESIIAPHLLQALKVRQFRNTWFNPVSLSLVVMALMILILMGPSWRQQASPLTRDEAALVILMDASSSMLSQDVQPSRLQRAKHKVSDLLARRPGSPTALIAFAGSAHTVLSLTSDNQVYKQYLEAIQPTIMPRLGKFPEYALPLVNKIALDDRMPTTVLLVTDAVSDASLARFTEYFSQHPHQLLVWGMGSEKTAVAKIPALEKGALEALAENAGGHYFDLTIDKQDVSRILRQINAHYVITDDEAVPWLDSGYWLVFPALLLFALWFRKGWTLQWMLPLLLAFSLSQSPGARAQDSWFTDLWLTADQHGRWLVQQRRYTDAAAAFDNPMWKGLAYYYAEEFKLAAEYFSRVDSEIARFNRANALAHSQDYLLAVDLYRRILENNPGHAAAEKNRAIVQEIIDAINLMSESQADEPGAKNASRELGEGDAQRAEGAEKKVFAAALVQFSAEEVLADDAINQMWLRSVQQDASQFLAVKFSMQLEQRAVSP